MRGFKEVLGSREERSRRMREAATCLAQGLVDLYATTYGPRRARRYLGSCERQGLVIPEVPQRPAPAGRSMLAVALAMVLFVTGIASCGALQTISERVLARQRPAAAATEGVR